MERHGSLVVVEKPLEQQSYSTLEAVHPGLQGEVAERLRQGNAQFIDRTPDGNKVVVLEVPAAVNRNGLYDGLQVVSEKGVRAPRICGLKRRHFLIIVSVVIVAIVVAVAASVAAVLKSRSTNSPRPKGDPTTAQDQSGASNSSTNTQAANLPLNSGLAIISLQQNGVTFRRTFYQHGTTNAIMQSTWDANSNSSRSNIVTNSTVPVKKGTPISATVLSYGNFFDTHLVFLDPQNRMSGAFSNDRAGESWNFDRQLVNEALDVHPSSTIASLWHRCEGCVDNWVVMYHNNAGELRVRNGTNQGTARYQMDITPPVGSKLSLVQCGTSSAIMMFYTQERKNYAALYNYQWLITSQSNHGWSNASASGSQLATLPSGSPIAPFASNNCSSFGIIYTPSEVSTVSSIETITCSSNQICETQAISSAIVQPGIVGDSVVNRSTIATSNDTVTAFVYRGKKVKVMSWSGIQSSAWIFNGEQDTDGL